MKKILITGINSYIGTSLGNWLEKDAINYSVDYVSCRNEDWREKSFSEFDVVFHVAGIAHVATNQSMNDLYLKINRDLAISIADKAKFEGVKQFVFMSSILVYGESTNTSKLINYNTIPIPNNIYGISKLQAENGIKQLADESFKTVFIRPPMIYGKGSKGNYSRLSKIARKLPVFPDIENQRSVLYIENLCQFIKLMIDNEESGTFYPQNSEYVKTSEIVLQIAKHHSRQVHLTKLFNPLITFIGRFVVTINKAFGTLIYDKELSEYPVSYQIKTFEQSIAETER